MVPAFFIFMKWWQTFLLIAILSTGAFLRWTALDWDSYRHYHPDERFIAWVATTIERPSGNTPLFSPNQTTWNPFYWPPSAESEGISVPQDEQRNYAYGHFPLYMGVATTRAIERVAPHLQERLPADWQFTQDVLNGAERIEYRHLTAVTRWLTGLLDTLTILVLFWLGKRVWSVNIGLLASGFLALNVMHIQLSHFFTTDPYLTFFVVCAITSWVYAITSSSQSAQKWFLFLGAICTGLAVGSKFSAILLVIPLAVTLLLLYGWQKTISWGVLLGGTAVMVFALTNPFAIIDQTCDLITPAVDLRFVQIPKLNWGSCYLSNILTQSRMVDGSLDAPFTRQYEDTISFIYHIEMQLRWGMGYLLGGFAFAGFGWVCWQAVQWLLQAVRQQREEDVAKKRIRPLPQQLADISPIALPNLVILAWVLPFFLSTGDFYVKFMRYLQPITPFLILYGVVLLVWLIEKQRRIGQAILSLTLLMSLLYAVAFVNQYQAPHPWITGSEWIFRNVPARSLILSEQWDDSIPSSLEVDGERRRRSEYRNGQLSWHTYADEKDNLDRLYNNLDLLEVADYVTIVSNRAYGVAPQQPDRFPLSSQYHQLLFDGELGYELVFVNGRFPSLGSYQFHASTFGTLTPPAEVDAYLADSTNWGRADESFIVYDQPLTMIFQNTGGLTMEEMLALFELPESVDKNE